MFCFSYFITLPYLEGREARDKEITICFSKVYFTRVRCIETVRRLKVAQSRDLHAVCFTTFPYIMYTYYI